MEQEHNPNKNAELAMEQNDLPGLTALLDEGRRRKEEVDGH